MLSPDPAAVADTQNWEQWLDSIPCNDTPPPLPQCGMCEHHRRRGTFISLLTDVKVPALEYCTLRASAGIESRMQANDPYAESCPFYVEEVPF